MSFLPYPSRFPSVEARGRPRPNTATAPFASPAARAPLPAWRAMRQGRPGSPTRASRPLARPACATSPTTTPASAAAGPARGSRYRGPDGEPIQRPRRARADPALAIPPAWTDVWICPRPNGHIQATGRDARGPQAVPLPPALARAVRDETKYGRMIAFGRRLPRDPRARRRRTWPGRGLPREKVLAAVVRLLETTLIRVGNDEYARANESLRPDDAARPARRRSTAPSVRFEFRGKSGKHARGRRPTTAAWRASSRRCQDLPGQELFQYLDEDGERRDDRLDGRQRVPARGRRRATSPPRTSAPGPAPSWPPWRSWRSRPCDTETEAKRNVVRGDRGGRRRSSATRRRSAASATSTPRSSRATPTGASTGYWEQRVDRARENPQEGLRPEEAAVLATLERLAARQREAA